MEDIKRKWLLLREVSFKIKIIYVLIIILTISAAIILLGRYAIILWALTSLYFFTKKDKSKLRNFILLDYKIFKIKLLTTVPRIKNQFFDQVNRGILKSFINEYKDINFIIREDDDFTGMCADTRDNVNYIQINKRAFTINPEDFEFTLFHELGHIRGKHSSISELLISGACLIFIFAPFLLPFFWLIGNSIQRNCEIEAHKFAISKTSVEAALKFLEPMERDRLKSSPTKELLNKLAYLTVSARPSLKKEIKSVKKLLKTI